jgi:hypothetical protein
MARINKKELDKPKRLTDKEMRELLKRAKAKADKMPEEKDSCSVEVFCSGKDIAKTSHRK